MQRLIQHRTRVMVMLILVLGYFTQAFAQDIVIEVEPNESCLQAQDIEEFTVPFILEGSLDNSIFPDVDFYRFSATPGTPLVADLEGQATGKGTLSDPFLGLFNSNCDLLEINDDFNSPNSRLDFEVPGDGVFILAASSCCDDGFIGAGGSSGTYQITISPPPPAIGSIMGRVVDAVSGQPLPGDKPPFARVDLLRCNSVDNCFEFVNSQNLDSEGQFLFDRDFSGRLLIVDNYQVRAFANEYQQAETEPFAVDEDEDFDLGDIQLIPPPIAFSDIEPCDKLLPQGGTCRYSVRINNNTSAPLRGLAWSLVDGSGLGSSLGFASFEASSGRLSSSRRSVHVRRQRVFLEAFSSDVFEYQFGVPSFVRDGATFCTRLFFGLQPYPLVNTNREGFLFCVNKGVTGFEVMSASESQKLFRSLSGRNTMMKHNHSPARKR